MIKYKTEKMGLISGQTAETASNMSEVTPRRSNSSRNFSGTSKDGKLVGLELKLRERPKENALTEIEEGRNEEEISEGRDELDKKAKRVMLDTLRDAKLQLMKDEKDSKREIKNTVIEKNRDDLIEIIRRDVNGEENKSVSQEYSTTVTKEIYSDANQKDKKNSSEERVSSNRNSIADKEATKNNRIEEKDTKKRSKEDKDATKKSPKVEKDATKKSPQDEKEATKKNPKEEKETTKKRSKEEKDATKKRSKEQQEAIKENSIEEIDATNSPKEVKDITNSPKEGSEATKNSPKEVKDATNRRSKKKEREKEEYEKLVQVDTEKSVKDDTESIQVGEPSLFELFCCCDDDREFLIAEANSITTDQAVSVWLSRRRKDFFDKFLGLFFKDDDTLTTSPEVVVTHGGGENNPTEDYVEEYIEGIPYNNPPSEFPSSIFNSMASQVSSYIPLVESSSGQRGRKGARVNSNRREKKTVPLHHKEDSQNADSFPYTPILPGSTTDEIMLANLAEIHALRRQMGALQVNVNLIKTRAELAELQQTRANLVEDLRSRSINPQIFDDLSDVMQQTASPSDSQLPPSAEGSVPVGEGGEKADPVSILKRSSFVANVAEQENSMTKKRSLFKNRNKAS